jgi:hypothetical protein
VGPLPRPGQTILRTAQYQGHLRAAGRADYVLGSALAQLGRLDEADRTLGAAEHATRAVQDDAVHTGILNRRAHMCQYRAHRHHAEALHREAVDAGEAYASTAWDSPPPTSAAPTRQWPATATAPNWEHLAGRCHRSAF